MTKPIIAVSIKTLGGTTVAVSDATAPGVGGAVYAALLNGQDLHFNNGTNEYVIPYNAIDSATVTRTTATVEDPVDSLCVVESTSNGEG